MTSSSIYMDQVLDTGSAPIDIPDDDPSAEAIRREHLRAEANLKATGALLLLAAAHSSYVLLRDGGTPSAAPESMPPVLLGLGLIVAFVIGGVLLRQLKPMGRWLFTALAVIATVRDGLDLSSMLGDPMMQPGTMPSIPPLVMVMISVQLMIFRCFILYSLWNRRGRMVTSAHYRNQVVSATSHLTFPRRISQVTMAFVLTVALIIFEVIFVAVSSQ